MQEIGAALRAASVGADAAGRLAEDAFGIVTKAGNDPGRDAALIGDLADTIRGAGIPDGQVDLRIATIDLSFGGLSDKEAALALAYAMSSFVKSVGGSLDIGSLQDGLAEAMRDAVSRFVVTRKILADERFTLVYQPVVDLKQRAVHHHEALTRFSDGADTFTTVAFSEDVGLIMDLDLSVCRRAIKAMEQSDNASVAVNLSGRSVQNDAFRRALSELIGTLGNRRHHLLFELTEFGRDRRHGRGRGLPRPSSQPWGMRYVWMISAPVRRPTITCAGSTSISSRSTGLSSRRPAIADANGH